MDNLMLKIIKDLTPLNRNLCSREYDRALCYLQEILPLRIIKFSPRQPFNAWHIPPKWDLVKATISFQGQIIYEVKYPLQIIGLSKSFRGRVSLEELRNHLYYDHRYEDAVPYHFRQNYRCWDRSWGFCVTKKFYDSLVEGDYDIEIITQESKGSLKIVEYTLPGKHAECFAFVAHLDHPGMANDDLAGVAVGVELFRRLSEKKRKFSYKLVLVPEIIGSEHYLGVAPEHSRHILESCFLEMLGSKTQLLLQHSKEGNSNLENVLESCLRDWGVSYRTGPFESIICNDEYIWETYGIPMASLSRYPYPEYHCSKDNFSIIDKEALEGALQILEDAILHLESSKLLVKKFSGNLCLSNPVYDLYVDPGRSEFGSYGSEFIQKKRLLMDLIPTFHRPIFLNQIADRVGMPQEDVEEYLLKWQKKGLVELK